ncbi:hypothetical protein KV697_11150 [Sphingomonas sanguinis]|uniref:hypothetical protein n=1 Tax=Sphingomonas sanguinis TaxID=33051 RepID=UPI001C57C26C|nr:hypothetical protein [Sphingomonas sanguinis]QXT34383.1 hypothetical protein KV697_11150 [Sphingomonas sanguinis]
MLKNVFAISAHGQPDCVEDLILNLRTCDPNSPIVLYDGGKDRSIIAQTERWQQFLVDVVPNPQPQAWGSLHGYAIACIDHISDRQYDTITFVDSDQLMIKRGYSEYLSEKIPLNFGVLSTLPRQHGIDSPVLCVQDFHADRANWLPYLSLFDGWEDVFVRWTFWPGTVLSSGAARALAAEFKTDRLDRALRGSRAWATEECLIPTISGLLGFNEMQNPCDGRWNKFRTAWKASDVDGAISAPGAFFMHPIARRMDDPVRTYIRNLLIKNCQYTG